VRRRDLTVADRGRLLSRLHRKAEALDQACLRAQGHPHDYAIQQELLSALEWEDTLEPDHARAVIRDLFKQVRDQSAALSTVVRSSPDAGDRAPHPISHVIPNLRQNLAALMHALAARHSQPPADQSPVTEGGSKSK
jgi:hypothetical protein